MPSIEAVPASRVKEAGDGRLRLVAEREEGAGDPLLEPGADLPPENGKVEERAEEQIQTAAGPELVPQKREPRRRTPSREESPMTSKERGKPLSRDAGTVAAGAAGLLTERANHTDPQESEGLDDSGEISDGKENGEIRIQNETRVG